MKKREQIKIKYKSGMLYDTPGYKEYDYDYINASKSHVKRFNSAIMILMGIDGCERNLMDWIGDNMTGGNFITNNDVTRKNFMSFHEKYKKKDKRAYSENTIKIAFQRLSSAGLLIAVPKSKGTYLVNPFHYFIGDDESRVKAIRMVMEFSSGIDTKISVDVTE